jgi:hypothetical protein
MDYGFDYKRTEGLFSKMNNRKGIMKSAPLDLDSTAMIRLKRRERGTPAMNST